ncbi:MAG TPA: penicillin-binding protein 2 [Candidatus Levybacteria bacterium]|nr:penicillin-binding protein 2 [Candidatus Levybacteria bacterium]
MNRPTTFRITLVLAFFGLLYGFVLIRLFYWQVVRAEDLRDQSKLQSYESLLVDSARGEILASDGFPLATNKPTFLVYANPKQISDRQEVADILGPLLERDPASISALLKQDLFWVRLKSQIDGDTRDEIQKLDIPGIGFQQESIRLYPEASMAAHMVGFLGKTEQGEDRGYFGVEGYYNEQLKGRPGRLYVVKDALGNPVISDVREEKKIDGRALTLTIDRAVQFIADRELKEGVARYQAEGGSVIILESKTGKILAASSVPDFDPQNYYEFDPDSYRSPIIASLYEPGSTFKVLVMAAGINEKVVKPDTRCNTCDKPVEISGYKIKTWNDKYYPNTTMTEVIQHSDNTGMVYVAQKLGQEKFIQYLDKFGIGSLTGIDVQGESSGIIRDRETWLPIDLATASFGQGISITPVQLVAAVNAIANEGKILKPHVVSSIMTEKGKTITIVPEVTSEPITKTTSEVMTWMMVNSVEKGESQWTKLPGYRVAGKTGTAQIPVAGHYDPTKTIASFVGFFPADDPKVTMLVLVDRPKTSIYGSETAAPIFFDIARNLVNYYNVKPNF